MQVIQFIFLKLFAKDNFEFYFPIDKAPQFTISLESEPIAEWAEESYLTVFLV